MINFVVQSHLFAKIHHKLLRLQTGPWPVPGKVCIFSLEFFLAETCNLKCFQCAALSPLLGKANLPSLESFERSLSFLAPVMRVGQLKLLGGEPLLNNEICAFMRVARGSGVFRKIRVATNGLLLPKMCDEFWKLADVVEVSLYPGARDRLPEATRNELARKAARFHTRLELRNVDEFSRSCSDERIDDPIRVRQIFSECREAHEWSCHLLHGNRLYRCSRVPSLDAYLREQGTTRADFTGDGIFLDARPTLRGELRDYLRSERPLRACRYCLGTTGPTIPHRQMTAEEIRSMKGMARSLVKNV